MACGFNWQCTANGIGYVVSWSQHAWTPYRLITSTVYVHPDLEAARAGCRSRYVEDSCCVQQYIQLSKSCRVQSVQQYIPLPTSWRVHSVLKYFRLPAIHIVQSLPMSWCVHSVLKYIRLATSPVVHSLQQYIRLGTSWCLHSVPPYIPLPTSRRVHNVNSVLK